MGPNMRSPVDTSYLADGVVMMRMFEHAGKVKKAISALKKRSGPHEESIRQIWFDDEGIHLSEPLAICAACSSGVPIELGAGHQDSQSPSAHSSIVSWRLSRQFGFGSWSQRRPVAMPR